MRRLSMVYVAPVLLGVILFGVLALVARDTYVHFERPSPGFLVYQNGQLSAIGGPSWSGAQAGMPLNGGRIVGVDGGDFVSGHAVYRHAAERPLGETILYRVRFAGEERDFAVPTMATGSADFWLTAGNYLSNAAFCFAIAILALLLRPDHPSARALAFVMVLLGLTLALGLDHVVTFRFTKLYPIAEAMVPAGILALTLTFPVPRFTIRVRWLGIAFASGATLVMGVLGAAWEVNAPDRARGITNAVFVLWALTALAMLVSFGHATIYGRSESDRLKAGVVFSGALISFLLPAVALVAFFLLGWDFSTSWLTALIFLFPVSVLYAVVRHDLFEAERFIRLTVGYGVATAGVVLVYATLLTILERMALPLSPGAATSFILLVGLALAFDPVRRSVQRSIDRVFFRSVEAPERVLEEAGIELASLTDEGAIRETLAERVRAALNLEWANVRDTEPSERPVSFSEPVNFQGEQLGVLEGGRKLTGAPFAAADRELIRGLAAQGALALQNAHSIDGLRRAQAELLRTQRLAVIGEFAGAVAHGMRNPLAGIRATAQIAQEQATAASQSPVAETLEGVLSEADRLDQRIRSLLDFSRPVEPRPKQVDVGELIERVARTLSRSAERRGVRILTTQQPSPSYVVSDLDYLEETLLELVGNALRATETGGEVRLEHGRGDDQVVIRVRDDGSGIPEAVQDRVFDLFFTTRPDGTGLGLPSVRKIVEMLGGSIELESSGPGGTCFRVELPLEV
ncbi:MAG: hypothetical protein JRG95_15655 [Deltaproteobacteria bacterium]|nr:hypothetical protein [Deltaproteobacteria bacterium]